MTLATFDTQQDYPPLPTRAPEWITRMEPALQLAGIVAHTDFVPGALRGNEPAIAACIMYGLEIGIGPMQALQSIHIIDGRPQPSSELMRALVQSAGHELWTVESTRVKATVRGRRRNSAIVAEATFTMEDAKDAGIAFKSNWKKYPRAMLRARAYGDLCRDHFAAETRGLTTDEPSLSELAAEAPTDGPTGAETGAAGQTMRRKARKASRPVEGPATGTSGSIGRGEDDEPAPVAPVAPEPAGGRPLGMDTQERIDHIPVDEPPDKITDAQLRKINATLRDLGVTTRVEKLMIVAGIIGRDVDTSSKLTVAEGSQVIERLVDVQNGVVDLNDLLGDPL